MALSAVGLKTHIWNNRLKSILFLIFYPIIITATYMSVLGVLFLYAASENTHGTKTGPSLIQVYQTIVFSYWYVPYVFLGICLLAIYLKHRNRVDIAEDTNVVTRESHPKLIQLLEEICISRGLTMPMFFIQNHESCNAYTFGLTESTYRIVITSGLVEKLSDEELQAVLANQIVHLINGDTTFLFMIGMLTHIFANLVGGWPDLHDTRGYRRRANSITDHTDGKAALVMIAIFLLLSLANIGVLFAHCFISKRREFIADAGAVELTKNPGALISALSKIEKNTFGFYRSHLVKPLLIHYKNFGEFVTHPKISDRVAAISYYNRMENPTVKPWDRSTVRQAKKAEVVW